MKAQDIVPRRPPGIARYCGKERDQIRLMFRLISLLEESPMTAKEVAQDLGIGLRRALPLAQCRH